MKTTEYLINYSKGILIKDILLDEYGYWGIDKNKNLIHNDLIISNLNKEISLRFPFFRKFDKNLFLIIDGEDARNKKNNTWIISENGYINEKFHIGEGAYKVIVLNCKIIIAYSDCVIGCCPIGTNRLIIFDERGKILKKFGFELGQEVKSICAKNETEIYIQELYPPHVVHINLETWELTKFEFPLSEYAEVMTYSKGELYFGFRNSFSKSFDDIKNGQMNIFKSNIKENHKIELEYIGKVDYQTNCVSVQKQGSLIFTDYHIRQRKDNKLKIWVTQFN